MENPETWNDDTKAVLAAMDHHSNQITQGICGLSVMATIEQKVIRPIREENTRLERALRGAYEVLGTLSVEPHCEQCGELASSTQDKIAVVLAGPAEAEEM